MRNRKIKMLGYYAHSMKIYNTKKERDEMEFIRNKFHGNIICPNKDLSFIGREIQPYLDFIANTDIVFASEYYGYLGKGVFEECKFALESGIEVFIIKERLNGTFYLEKLKSVEVVSEWNFAFYGKTHTKKCSPKKLPYLKTV